MTNTWKRDWCVRGVWESRCAVKGCDQVTRLVGPWQGDPQSPPFFRSARGCNGDLEGGWVFFRSGYLAYNTHPKVSYPSMILCPEHAPTWKDYCAAMNTWDNAARADRKTWWQTMLESIATPFRSPPSKHPMPKTPFESVL